MANTIEVKARGIYQKAGYLACANCNAEVDVKKQGFCDNCSACLSMKCSHCLQEMPLRSVSPKFCGLCGEPVDLAYRPVFHPEPTSQRPNAGTADLDKMGPFEVVPLSKKAE